METIYVKRFIKTEDDLPKEKGEYFAHRKSDNRLLVFNRFVDSDLEFETYIWMRNVDYWLQPTTLAELIKEKLPTKEDIAIEIVATFLRYNPHPNQRANLDREKKAFANGAMYVINKLTE